jgi:uncharacterized protein (DUF362 family)
MQDKKRVYIQRSMDDDIKGAVYTAIGKIYHTEGRIQSVIIKPNLCYYWDASTGETTDKRVVAAIIDYVREKINPGADIRIAEADATSMKTKYVFDILGYTKLAKEKEVVLLNLCDDASRIFTIRGKDRDLQVPLPVSMIESDLVINVPKIKVPRRVPLTCSMKNLFGAIHHPIKAQYHPHLHEVIAGVNSIIRPDLVVVDGIVALGKYPKKLNVIVTGTDSVAVDWVIAGIIGYRNPKKIRYIRLSDPERYSPVHIEGEDPDMIRKEFPRMNISVGQFVWRCQLAGIRYYTRISGDVVPPIIGDLR